MSGVLRQAGVDADEFLRVAALKRNASYVQKAKRRTLLIWSAAASSALIMLAGLSVFYVYVGSNSPFVEVRFLSYTNDLKGDLVALLEIRNRSNSRIARNNCRITPESGASSGFWYAADVPSHRFEAQECERVLVTLQAPLSRWRATVNCVRNPTSLEWDIKECLEWLKERRLAPSFLADWIERRCRAAASTDWIDLPSSTHK